MKKIFLVVLICTLYCFPTFATPLSTLSVYTDWNNVFGKPHIVQNVETFIGPLSRFDDFWYKKNERIVQCFNGNSCIGSVFDSDIGEGSSWYSGTWWLNEELCRINAEQGMDGSGLVYPSLYSDPNESKTSFYVYEGFPALDVWGNSYPDNSTIGFVSFNLIYHYTTSYNYDDEWTEKYNILGIFDEISVPEGYKSYMETFLFVTIFDSWLDSDNNLNEYREIFVNETVKGDFSKIITVNNNLNEVIPESPNNYAKYKIFIETRLTFAPITETIITPESNTLFLFGVGILSLFYFIRRKSIL